MITKSRVKVPALPVNLNIIIFDNNEEIKADCKFSEGSMGIYELNDGVHEITILIISSKVTDIKNNIIDSICKISCDKEAYLVRFIDREITNVYHKHKDKNYYERPNP